MDLKDTACWLRDINYGNAQTCLDLENISERTGDGDLACGPFYADSSFYIGAGEIPSDVTLHMPYGSQPVVTGPNPNPITLVGLRQYSSPSCNPFTAAGCPQDGIPVFSSIFSQNTIANSNYNSLQASLEKRFTHGLQFQLAYTWSKSIDDASSFENILRPIAIAAIARFRFSTRDSAFVLSYLWELPSRKYKGAKGKFLNGWAVSGITSFQTGSRSTSNRATTTELKYSSDFELPGNQI